MSEQRKVVTIQIKVKYNVKIQLNTLSDPCLILGVVISEPHDHLKVIYSKSSSILSISYFYLLVGHLPFDWCLLTLIC